MSEGAKWIAGKLAKAALTIAATIACFVLLSRVLDKLNI